MTRARTGHRDDRGHELYAGDLVCAQRGAWPHVVVFSPLREQWVLAELTAEPRQLTGCWRLLAYTNWITRLELPPLTQVPTPSPDAFPPDEFLDFMIPLEEDSLFPAQVGNT